MQNLAECTKCIDCPHLKKGSRKDMGILVIVLWCCYPHNLRACSYDPTVECRYFSTCKLSVNDMSIRELARGGYDNHYFTTADAVAAGLKKAGVDFAGLGLTMEDAFRIFEGGVFFDDCPLSGT